MLRISDSQQKALRHTAREAYVRELSLRVAERTPELARTLDEEQLDNASRRALEAAETFGFTNRGPVRMYFDLCVTFGQGFVHDPVHSWAAEAIGDPDPETQTERAEVLFSKAMIAVDEIYGPDNVYALAALRALSAWARQPLDIPDSRLEDYVVWQMHAIHPEKADFAGTEAMRSLFSDAQGDCQELGVTAARPIILLTALKFAFGAGCLNDPLYRWIGATLRQEKVTDIGLRFERLERKALTWLDAVLAQQA